MAPSPQYRSLILAATILATFLAAVSMNMQRLQGWSFILLCVIAVMLGAVGYIWARDRVLSTWEQLPKSRRLLLIALMAAIVLGARLIVNRHKSGAQFADAMAALGVLVALALLGLYRRMSHR